MKNLGAKIMIFSDIFQLKIIEKNGIELGWKFDENLMWEIRIFAKKFYFFSYSFKLLLLNNILKQFLIISRNSF